MTDISDPLAAFIDAACVPLDASHASGTLARAEAILGAHPEVARSGIHAAAILGDDEEVRRLVGADPSSATAKGGPRGWDALTHLCFSRYLRLDRARSDGFVRAARALLDAGASANTGWFEPDHQPSPEWEPVLYGAAGIAHHAGLTRLLLERGADPNAGEVAYHSPEGFDNEAMQALVESGRLTRESLTTMLVRKLDWTDYDGAAWLLAHGADPNYLAHWGNRALHHSLQRDNPLRFVELLLDHGADPTLLSMPGRSAFAVAARMGRGDALDLFERRGFSAALAGDDAFLAACARGDEARARALAPADPGLVARLQAEDCGILSRFAGAGNTAAVRLLLDLGFDVGRAGAGGRTALHLAAWRARGDTVRLLLERGAPVEAADAHGDTPLSLALRALVEHSEWTPHASPEIIQALLAAGARSA
ncbi:MAG TPA: ankyrin repeat domain-containing protein [Longimicrobium sp.]|jgi:hypothetical protein|nr:ankyrin repeat domain-containing protein [Longimicrobium sp.]